MKKKTILFKITMATIVLVCIGLYACHDSSRLSTPMQSNATLTNDSVNGQDTQDAIIRYDILYESKSHFQFENIAFEDTKLIPFLLDKKDKEIVDFTYPKTYTELESFKRKERVPTDVFKVFANFNTINGWSKYMKELSPSKEEIIKDIIDGYFLYYCGQVKLSQAFDSFLFMKESSWVNYRVRDVYLVNMYENKITSISLLFYYYGGDEDTLAAYTYKDKDSIFYRCSKTLSNDVIIPEEVKETVGCDYDDETIFKFKFGKTGHIVIM